MTLKATEGRWVYTSPCPIFEGDTGKARAYNGSIHAGWEDSPEFSTPDEFYAWAQNECAKRNTLETAAPVMRDALMEIRGWREIGSADTPSEKLRAIEKICDAALASARGEA